jgi:hypothetical protein
VVLLFRFRRETAPGFVPAMPAPAQEPMHVR